MVYNRAFRPKINDPYALSIAFVRNSDYGEIAVVNLPEVVNTLMGHMPISYSANRYTYNKAQLLVSSWIVSTIKFLLVRSCNVIFMRHYAGKLPLSSLSVLLFVYLSEYESHEFDCNVVASN